jgi:hypothetical protein
MYKTAVKPALVNGCENFSVMLREKQSAEVKTWK